MEFILCNTYVDDAETYFNIRHSIYKVYVLGKTLISARRRISNTDHDFNKHAKFTLIKSIQYTNKLSEKLQNLLNLYDKTFGLKI